jgi:uncharacterized membrane protein YqjE
MLTANRTTPEAVHPMDALKMLRSAGGALFTQATLYGELARVEWAAEKSRLLKMTGWAVLGAAFLLCTMLSAGALVMALSWNTVYRIPAAVALLACYGLGGWLAWRRFQALEAQGEQSFAATRAELGADLELLQGRLGVP